MIVIGGRLLCLAVASVLLWERAKCQCASQTRAVDARTHTVKPAPYRGPGHLLGQLVPSETVRVDYRYQQFPNVARNFRPEPTNPQVAYAISPSYYNALPQQNLYPVIGHPELAYLDNFRHQQARVVQQQQATNAPQIRLFKTPPLFYHQVYHHPVLSQQMLPPQPNQPPSPPKYFTSFRPMVTQLPQLPQLPQLQQLPKPVVEPNQNQEENASDEKEDVQEEEPENDEDDSDNGYRFNEDFFKNAHYEFPKYKEAGDDDEREDYVREDDESEEDEERKESASKHVLAKPTYVDKFYPIAKFKYPKEQRHTPVKQYGYKRNEPRKTKYDYTKHFPDSKKKNNVEYKMLKYTKIHQPVAEIEGKGSEAIPVVHRKNMYQENWYITKSSTS